MQSDGASIDKFDKDALVKAVGGKTGRELRLQVLLSRKEGEGEGEGGVERMR